MSEPFDFEAFISGAQLARTTVSAFKVDHTTEINRLKDRYDEIRDRFDATQSGDAGDAREGVTDPTVSEVREIEDRIDTLRREMEGSRVEFTIRTLTPDEFRALGDGEDAVYEQFARQSVEPELTPEQAKRVADVVGAAQWGGMMMQANELVMSKAAVPDFSPINSASRSTRES
jgi:hypothetical protein